MTKIVVTATGIHLSYPGCAARVCYALTHTFPYGYVLYRREQTPFSSIYGAFSGPKEVDERRWKLTFFYYSLHISISLYLSRRASEILT